MRALRKIFSVAEQPPTPSESAPSSYEKDIFSGLESERQAGLELYAWFRQAWRLGRLPGLELLTDNRGHRVWEIGATAELPSLGAVPVIGTIQDIPLDRCKARPEREAQAAVWMREQARAFLFDQFLRVTSFDRSQPYPMLGHPTLPSFLEMLSWCPAQGVVPAGIRFYAKYFQKINGAYGRFPQTILPNFPPLGTLSEHYRWLWLQADPMEQFLALRFASSRGPVLRFPIKQPLSLLLAPEMIIDKPYPKAGLWVYGFGLILLGGKSQMWKHPSPTIYLLSLSVNEIGFVIVRSLFLSRSPQYPPPLPGFDPVRNTISIPDLLGRRPRSPTPSAKELDQAYLLSRTSYIYNLILQILPIWNWMPDWCDVTDQQLIECLDACQPPKLPHDQLC
ncbi:MAG: hypothetical protein AAF657_27970 [Acidobacteriota bacterium]